MPILVPLPNPHSEWADPELSRPEIPGLMPPSLEDPSVDLRLPVTRAEFAGIAVRVYENLANTRVMPAVNNPFRDTRDPEVLKAYNANIMMGVSADMFAPDDLLTREQAATALTRVFKRAAIPGWTLATDANHRLDFGYIAPFRDDAHISDWARESVYFMAFHGIITGIGNNMFAPRAVTPEEQARGYAQATREQSLIIALRMVDTLGID
jgi:hypothetical protein